MHPDFKRKAAPIKGILLDVDGVLTDGTFQGRGDDEVKRFHSRDGIGIVLARRAGIKIGLISGRDSRLVAERARELEIDFWRLGVGDKAPAYDAALDEFGLTEREIAYMGDDLPDLKALLRSGISATVADGHDEIRSRVDYVTRARGGHGAVRELIDELLKAQGVWDSLVAGFM